MNYTFTFLLLFFYVAASSQKLDFVTVLNDDISIRALENERKKVYYVGTEAKLGSVNLRRFSEQKQIRLSEKKLQFRTLAQDKKYLYTINIESPAHFFRINKKNLQSEMFFTDSTNTAFYDAFTFVGKNTAFAFSDPDENQKMRLAIMNTDEKEPKVSFLQNIQLHKGEAAFAASNSNIAVYKNEVWIATGGTVSRIIKINLENQKADLYTTPIIQGTPSQGAYSVDFANEHFGIMAGGDYTQQMANLQNIATTTDGGQTWKIQASGKNAGYITCVKIRPGSGGKEIIAVGDQHISYSADFGKTWTKISDEKNLYTCQWLNSKTLLFAGKNRILKAKFKL